MAEQDTGSAFVKDLATRLNNWGKWGKEDELGTLNYITREKVANASRSVKHGKVFSLSIPFERNGPMSSRTGRVNPLLYMYVDGADTAAGVQKERSGLRGTADDLVILSSQCATHWDALAHISYEGVMYNGRPCTLVSSRGARKNSIIPASKKIVSRGVLLDISRYKQVDALKTEEIITTEDLEGCCRKQKVTVETGDIVLLHTGYMTGFLARKDWAGFDHGDQNPGLSWKTAPWFHEHQVAAVATDYFGLEAYNESEYEHFPLHVIFLVHMGLMIGETWYLDELASDCAKDGIYEFLLVANPIPMKYAVGGMVNPTAIK